MGFLSDALSVVGTVGGLWNGMQTNNIASQQYAANMDLAKNRHQYEVLDLKAAGLNPILSANGGSVTLPTPTAGMRKNPYETMMQNIATAEQIDVMKSQQRVMASQEKKNDADAYLAQQQGDTQTWMRQLMEAQTYQAIAAGTNQFSSLALIDADIKLKNAQEKKTLADAELAQKQVDTFDLRVGAELNLLAAQTYAQVMAGKMSAASAVNQYAQAVTQGVIQGLYEQETANKLIEGQKMKIDLGKAQATQAIDTNPYYQTIKTGLNDITGLAGNVLLGAAGGRAIANAFGLGGSTTRTIGF